MIKPPSPVISDAVLDTGWPDTSRGLYALKKQKMVIALSNGNMRFLIDVVS